MTVAVAPVASPVTAPAAPARGTPEYIQAMASKYDTAQGITQPTTKEGAPAQQPEQKTSTVPVMPEGGSDKFYNKQTGAYNWEAHARELEFKAAQRGPKPPEQKPVAQPPQVPEGTDPAQAAAQSAGLDWNALTNKVEQTGTIEATDYEALAKAGIPKEVVDNYIASLGDAVAYRTSQIHQYAGGEEKTAELLTWAKTSLTPEEKAEYNAMLGSGQWKVALDSLKARRGTTSPTGEEGTLISAGSNVASNGETPFANQVEMVAAMSVRNERGQKRYEIDPDYRASVRKRIAGMK